MPIAHRLIEMWSWLVVVAVIAALWIPGGGCGSFTSGFPSLDEIRGNGSLLNRYSTHDGELRSVPAVRSTCSTEQSHLMRIAFIALPGVGSDNMQLVFNRSNNVTMSVEISGATQSFGEFGYVLDLPEEDRIPFNSGDTLRIKHPHYNDSSLRLLHQVGHDMINICWRRLEDGPEDISCENDYDYPLLAIETISAGCVEGSLSVAELKSMWENRAAPVLYSSPYRELTLDCSDTGYLSQILVGAYNISGRTGNDGLKIRTDNDDLICSQSTLQATEQLNVYECVLDSPVAVDEGGSVQIVQRSATHQIGFLRDGERDTPLISVNISGECSASEFPSETDLREMAALFIPNFFQVDGLTLLYPHLTITQDGYLVKWTFTAEDMVGVGRTGYPRLRILRKDENRTAQEVSMLQGSAAVSTLYPNVYEVTVDPVPVQDGDVIILVLPSINTARLLLSFILNGSPPGEDLDSDDVIEGLPLVTLQIVTMQTTVSSTIALSPTPSPPTDDNSSIQTTPPPVVPTNPPSRPTSDPNDGTSDRGSSSGGGDSTGAIVGAVVGLLVAATLVLALVLLLVCVLRRRKAYSVKVREQEEGEVVVNGNSLSTPMDNPVYSGCDTEPGTQDGVPEHQLPNPPLPSSATAATNGSRLYEVLEDVNGKGSKREINQSFDNPAYYSTLQDVHSNTDRLKGHTHNATVKLSPNHYEMGIYVPTQEQRQYVENCAGGTSENVYATLEETQVGKAGKTLSFFEECDTYWRPASTTEEIYQQLAQRKYREIPRHQIQITEHLGSGQFGTVNCGLWQGGGLGGMEVAVKMLQEGTSEEDTVRFLQEAAINGQFRHPNIVELLGVVTVGKPVMIVLELLSNGDLRNYLLKHKPAPGELPLSDTAGVLAQFCVQVARGMDYLSSKAFVHRDLAARNILITDTKTCKISDFGMSRDLEDGTYYVSQGGKIPVKWTAPEALHYKKYSTASDVWSFGCLMYEIWSLGHKPFEGYTNPDTVKLIDNGCRLAPPPGCPREMYRLMIICWNADKAARPQFREIVDTLSQSEQELLHIPEEVSRGHPQACVLGAPLEAGRSLYTELQNTYMP